METLLERDIKANRFGRDRVYAHWLKAQAAHPQDPITARVTFMQNLPSNLKALVPPESFDPSSGVTSFAREFLTGSARARILQQIDGLFQSLPAHVQTPVAGADGFANFANEGNPTPVLRFDRDLVILTPGKLGIIAVLTKDFVRFPDGRSAAQVGRLIGRAVVRGEDRVLLDDQAAVIDGRPAGLLYNISPSGSGSPAQIADDVEDLFDSVSAGDAQEPVFITSARGALYLRRQADTNGGSLFRDVGVSGGTIAGAKLIISAEARARLVLLDAAMLGVCDEGLTASSSQAGSVIMNDTPSPGAQQLVSLFQSSLVAIQLVRLIDWKLATDNAIGFIDLPIGSPA